MVKHVHIIVVVVVLDVVHYVIQVAKQSVKIVLGILVLSLVLRQ